MPDAYRRQRAVSFIIRSRADRKRFFSTKLFADPAWDILLQLYCTATERHGLALSDLAAAVDLQPPTAERWLEALEKEGLVQRCDRQLIRLSDSGWFAMDSYFENLSSGMI
jgi:DNA-binding MarR family transcriptional regulator